MGLHAKFRHLDVGLEGRGGVNNFKTNFDKDEGG